MYNFIISVDRFIIEFVQKYMHNSFLDKIMPFITSLGNIGLVWIIISIIMLISKKYRKAGILGIYSLIISAVLGELLLKNIIGRSRPFMEITSIKLLIPKPISYSFPSGHTASSFAAVAAFIKVIDNKIVIIPLALLGILIAFSRIYLLVHYPSDILGGIVLGLISAKLASIYLIFREKKSVAFNKK
ncbi:phosphatase PAP2 family protein [Paramaledivibacter caminithermalis]|jgi:undecaprenyl-diphosphatase|uniref:Undecaprenyl-diphosphatase n=1 Tax=Paramaledivibacter caminithermalis (strain DSM 15212 / CIP 107654 / DViRD3) TaxID=1121301 RepID=A0A1M6NZL2_PARC5|nr:phosphatase PAP2 family protein [Paramaledivibacter caminithermalis]SHK01136.1 undecaprenyl-diphosphatase [Paramaledivibacter caminithermalis DSM 15212]